MPPHQAREFFADLPQRSAGVINLAARATPSQAGLKIGNTAAERDRFRLLFRIDQREKAVQPVLKRSIVSETSLGCPGSTSAQVTDSAAVQRVHISARVVNIIAGNQPVRLAAV